MKTAYQSRIGTGKKNNFHVWNHLKISIPGSAKRWGTFINLVFGVSWHYWLTTRSAANKTQPKQTKDLGKYTYKN